MDLLKIFALPIIASSLTASTIPQIPKSAIAEYPCWGILRDIEVDAPEFDLIRARYSLSTFKLGYHITVGIKPILPQHTGMQD